MQFFVVLQIDPESTSDGLLVSLVPRAVDIGSAAFPFIGPAAWSAPSLRPPTPPAGLDLQREQRAVALKAGSPRNPRGTGSQPLSALGYPESLLGLDYILYTTNLGSRLSCGRGRAEDGGQFHPY